MHTNIDQALQALAEMEDGLRDDLGTEEAEVLLDAGAYSDLVQSVAIDCGPAVRRELARVTGVQLINYRDEEEEL